MKIAGIIAGTGPVALLSIVKATCAAGWLVACFVALSGCSRGGLEPGQPRIVDCPAAPGSQAPNLAVGLDGELYLSWIEPRERGHALRFATWDDGAWSAPRTIASGEDWFVNWADFPSMAALEDGTLVAHWLVRSGGEGYAYDVHVALSHDGGLSFGDPFRPHDDATQTEHGFVSLVPTAEGAFRLFWLDGRNAASTPPGPMALRSAELRARGELDSQVVIDESVCDCCATDALRTQSGTILVAYRDRSATEIRDISVARFSESTWSAPRTVHADNWEIAGCPVNGPALASAGGRVAVAWFTAAEDPPAVQVAFSHDDGRSFDPPIRVDEGSPHGRVDVALLADGTALVSWLEGAQDGARILVRRVRPSGALESTIVAVTSPSRSSGVPRMVLFQDRIVLAWTEPAEPSRVRTSVLSM